MSLSLKPPRVATNSAGAVASSHDYTPFGEELFAGMGGRTTAIGYPGASDGVRQKFTSKERDAETGLDFFGARYYSSAAGRFTSPDEFKGGPEESYEDVDPHDPLFYADTAEPQSLNKYHYCLNNPLRYVDPDGHQTSTADRVKEGARQVVDAAGGIARGIASSLSFGYARAPREDDSSASRLGQVAGTAIVLIAGGDHAALAAGGYLAAPETGGVTAIPATGAAAVSVWEISGAMANANRLRNTLMQRRGNSSDNPEFKDLKDHAARHSEQHPEAYYKEAVEHTKTGTKFNVRHDGRPKSAFVTRTGPDSFTFTSASRNGRRIYTHMRNVDQQYLRNKGITLPNNF